MIQYVVKLLSDLIHNATITAQTQNCTASKALQPLMLCSVRSVQGTKTQAVHRCRLKHSQNQRFAPVQRSRSLDASFLLRNLSPNFYAIPTK
jgi:hypothetical protein